MTSEQSKKITNFSDDIKSMNDKVNSSNVLAIEASQALNEQEVVIG